MTIMNLDFLLGNSRRTLMLLMGCVSQRMFFSDHHVSFRKRIGTWIYLRKFLVHPASPKGRFCCFSSSETCRP
ncbi:unnamed protein product [Prunus brigantina]